MDNLDDLMDGHPNEPLFTVADTDCSTFTNDPPPRVFLTQGAAEIPLGIVGLLSAPGGSSKSMLALGISLAVTSGVEYLGLQPVNQKSVLILSGEDDKGEIHRRIHAMLPVVIPDGADSFDTEQANAALSQLFVPELLGLSLKLSEKETDVYETQTFLGLMCALEPFEDLGLIIIDTASRFRGGSENAAEDTAFFISLCEQIAKHTGATVLVVTHSNKKGGDNQQSVRGSSALVDNARFVMTMEPDKDDSSLIDFRVAKNNYGPSGRKVRFKRLENGLLELLDDESSRAAKSLAPLPRNGAEIIERIAQDKNNGAMWSLREFCRKYGGTKKQFKISEARLRNATNALIHTGQLTQEQEGRKAILIPVIEEVVE